MMGSWIYMAKILHLPQSLPLPIVSLALTLRVHFPLVHGMCPLPSHTSPAYPRRDLKLSVFSWGGKDLLTETGSSLSVAL